MQQVDVLIVGAGPAGSTLSHFLHLSNIEHLLIDKALFPRDKTCGDGLTVDVLNVLKRINPELLALFKEQNEMLPSWGFCFHGPKGQEVRYDFRDAGVPIAPFFTSRRIDLDQFLIDQLPQGGSGRFSAATELQGLERNEQGFIAKIKREDTVEFIQCRIVIGAEGEKPVVTRHLGLEHFRKKENLLAAIRVYYKDIKDFHPGNHLEFFFDPAIMPGYLWAFPLTNNEANTGLGMLSADISARKINMKKRFFEVIERNPRIAARFAGAEALEKPQGWGLPTMSKSRVIGGDGYALIGDAGGMIESFTGKGIGPGMMSARIASEFIERAFAEQNFNFEGFHHYMYDYYSSEMKNTYRLQKGLRFPWLVNPIMSMATWSVVERNAKDRMIKEFLRWV